MKLKAVFLDKDGTLIPDMPLSADDNRISLNEGVIEGLQLLQSYGYLLVIVSNQSGIDQNHFTPEQLERVQSAIDGVCRKLGIYLDGFYYCPHYPNGMDASYTDCECNKPQPGLLLQAAGDMDIDLSSSWMIGDLFIDVEAGSRAGCKTILISKESETETISASGKIPQYQARDLAEAARYILTATN